MSKHYIRNLEVDRLKLKALALELKESNRLARECLVFIRGMASEVHAGDDPPHVKAAQTFIRTLLSSPTPKSDPGDPFPGCPCETHRKTE